MNNTLNAEDAINDLREVRAEITRLNAARGETVFNPAATTALEDVIAWIESEIFEPSEAAQGLIPIPEGYAEA